MTAMIRILHTADLHLDKDFFPENPKLSALRRKEQRALFANIMMYARDRQVDVILFSGDLLDSPVPTEETGNLLLREFENTPDAEIFIAPGQNDPFRPGSFYAQTVFPENVHVFSEERFSAFEIDRLNLTVYGYAFCHRKLARSPFAMLPQPDPERFNIFMGYGSLSGGDDCCQITEELIARTGADYFAPGHDHNGGELQKAGNTYYAVPGSPEGLSFDEPGKKGVRIAAMEKSEGELLLKSKSVIFSRRRFEKITIDATGRESGRDLIGELAAALRAREADADTLVQVVVTGRVPLSFRLRPETFDKLAEKVCLLTFKDETLMVCGEKEREEENKSFKSVFAGKVAEKTQDEQLRSEILKCGFESLECVR